MTIDYSIPGKVKFYMFDYIEQIVGDVDPAMMHGPCVTPAKTNLFTVNEDGIKLSKADADKFH